MGTCRFCRTKLREEGGSCPVCGIDRTKTSREELTTQEGKRLRTCRTLRFFGLFHILCGSPLLLFFLPLALSRLTGSGSREPAGAADPAVPMFLAVGAVLVVLGFGLWTLRSWSFYLAVLLYGTAALGSIVLSVVKPTGTGPFGVIILLVFLSILGGPMSRKVLLRR